MNQRQRRFAAEFLLDADRRAAAVRAGYRPDRATRQGCELMHNPQVGYAIAMAQRQRSLRTGITRERVLLELARIAFADLARLASWGDGGLLVKRLEELGDADAAAIAEVKSDGAGRPLALQFHDKGSALEILARYCGLYDPGAGEAKPSGRERLMARLKPYLEAAAREEETGPE
jgi:phage terminase small subunit